MRTISIRQFNRNFYQEIQDLPVVVTKHGKPVLIVSQAPDDYVGNPDTTVKGLNPIANEKCE